MPIDTLIEEKKKSGHITYMSKIWILRVFREKSTLYLILIVNYFKYTEHRTQYTESQMENFTSSGIFVLLPHKTN